MRGDTPAPDPRLPPPFRRLSSEDTLADMMRREAAFTEQPDRGLWWVGAALIGSASLVLNAVFFGAMWAFGLL